MRARHIVLAILFGTYIVSFMDRMVMSVAIPFIAADYHLGPMAMGAVMSAFFATYALSQIPGGLLADKFGVRKVATVAMLWWSVFTAVTGLAANLTQMFLVRLAFGAGEGMFPACSLKTIAVWFPKRERSSASAIMLASNSLGAALAPLIVVPIVSLWGWRSAFFSLFFPGVLIALLFFIFVPNKPSESRRVSPEELVEIEGGEDAAGASPSPQVGLLKVFMAPNVPKYFLVLFTFDIAYWGFTTWLPTYLIKSRGFSAAQMGVAASLPFLAGTVGCVIGGWVSDRYFSQSRRTPIIATQLVSALLLYLTLTAPSAHMAVLYETMAGFFLMLFFSTFWALPMNTVPKDRMGVTSGFINMAGQIAAFISPLVMGYLIGAAKGNFDHAFIFLILSLLASCVVVFTIPSNLQPHENVAFRG